MAVKVELNIPPHFFDSAKAENNFESVSERIAKAFLRDVLRISSVMRGDPEKHEPDYVLDDQGYEVTFAINQSLIPQLKGVRPLDTQKYDIEKALINDIADATSRKAAKSYSCIPSLVIITVNTLPTWYHSLYFEETDPFARLAWKVHTAKRDKLFVDLYTDYIQKGKFQDIFIIQPTYDGSFAFFTISAYGSGRENFVTLVQTNKPKAFPTYRVIDAGTPDDVKNFETTVINYSTVDEFYVLQ